MEAFAAVMADRGAPSLHLLRAKLALRVRRNVKDAKERAAFVRRPDCVGNSVRERVGVASVGGRCSIRHTHTRVNRLACFHGRRRKNRIGQDE
jgi:hypothetical protein